MSTYTIKRDPSKYANLHSCDAKYWHQPIDFSTPCEYKELVQVWKDNLGLIKDILKAKAFKPENLALAEELKALHEAEFHRMWNKADNENIEDVSVAEQTFVVYQLWRYTMRLWYRDTRAAREATRPAPAKQEKPKAEAKAKKDPAKQDKPKAKKAPAKQETAKANEALFVSKLTKAQKKELLLALMTELLK